MSNTLIQAQANPHYQNQNQSNQSDMTPEELGLYNEIPELTTPKAESKASRFLKSSLGGLIGMIAAPVVMPFLIMKKISDNGLDSDQAKYGTAEKVGITIWRGLYIAVGSFFSLGIIPLIIGASTLLSPVIGLCAGVYWGPTKLFKKVAKLFSFDEVYESKNIPQIKLPTGTTKTDNEVQFTLAQQLSKKTKLLIDFHVDKKKLDQDEPLEASTYNRLIKKLSKAKSHLETMGELIKDKAGEAPCETSGQVSYMVKNKHNFEQKEENKSEFEKKLKQTKLELVGLFKQLQAHAPTKCSEVIVGQKTPLNRSKLGQN